MRMFEITEKQILALKAVIYGCNTNRRLVGSVFVSGIGSESEQTISFYDAIRIADDLLEQFLLLRRKEGAYADEE